MQEFTCKLCGESGEHRKNRKECKKCEVIYNKQWKKKKPEKQLVYNKKISVKRRAIKRLCVQYLGGICQMEGGCKYPLKYDAAGICFEVFHFHHRDRSTKKFDLSGRLRNHSRMKGGIFSISDLRKADPALLEELDKCELLCGNCHNHLENCGLDCDGCTR